MKTTTDCLSTAELQQLLTDALPDQQQVKCAAHLDHCACCQAKLEELATGDSNLSRIVERLDEAQPAARSAYWPAIQAAAAPASLAQTMVADTAPRSREAPITFLQPATDPAYLGRLAHFDVMRILGRGGMGIVLEAFDSRLQRNVALKVLDPDLAHDETARQRFCREARAAASITHENVVAVHQVERAEDGVLPYMVMQLISGESLEQRLLREKKLSVQEIVRIGLQAAQGLAAAHAQGLTHRDIKPGNILLEPPSGRVKLTDFGLARIADDVKLTRTGFVSGTPLYMAPEQALGESSDPRSDLFSLGAILYEMCAGQPPFEGNSALAILRQITEVKHRPVRELNPDIPDWLAEVVDDLLAKKPEDRYQSAAELAEVLDFHWTHLRTSSGELPSVCQVELARRSFRNRIILGTLGAGLLAMGIAAGVFLPRAWNSVVPAASAGEPEAVLAANAGSVWSVAFDPESKTAAMAVEDGSVRLWTLSPPAVQATFEAHRGAVWSMKFLQDGELLATVGDDGKLKIWDRDSLALRKTFEHANAVRALAIAEDGRLFAGDRLGHLQVWSLDSEQPLATAEQASAVLAVAISPDGKLLATSGSDKTIRLWNADSLQQRLLLEGHAGPVYALSFSPSGDRLASAGWDGAIRVWDPAAGTLALSWDGKSGDIWSVAFSPRENRLATGGTDGSVKLWEADKGKLLAEYRGHKTAVHTIAFNADGALLASGGRDGAVRVWKVK